MPTSSTGRGAFTLVELIVVMVIISVLLTMAAPRLLVVTGSARLRESAARLAVTARYARDFAVTHRCVCRLMIEPSERRYALAYQRDPQRSPGEFGSLRTGVGRAERLGEGVRFGIVRIEPRVRLDGIPPGRDCITFDAFGQADAAVVQITDGRRTYSILVAPAGGRVRLADEAVSELPNDRQDLDD